MIDPEAIDPIVDAMLPGPFEAGFHTLSLAESGIGYEALDALSRGVQQNPEDPQPRMQRSAMLEPVGLVIPEDR